MPIEIRELTIKVTINEPAPNEANTVTAHTTEAKEAIINQCIEEVIEMMNHKKER